MSTDKVHVFVGTTSNGEDAEAEIVLEHSLRKNTDRDVSIHWMRQSHDPLSPFSGWSTQTWATPFSGFRWAVPHLAAMWNLKKAIYMDVDMLVQADIGDLWDIPTLGKPVVAKQPGRLCVALFDVPMICDILMPLSRMKIVADMHQRYMGMFSNPDNVGLFDPRWNAFDGENFPLDTIKILHYTDMSTQPWVPHVIESRGWHWYDGPVRKHRRQDAVDLWYANFREATEAGMKVSDRIPEEPFGAYTKESQAHYNAANGFDVSRGQ